LGFVIGCDGGCLIEGYVVSEARLGTMARDLVLAVGIPLALVLGMTLWLANRDEPLPAPLQRLSRREAILWNGGIGLIIGLSALRYVLSR
jgi:hypothetical protein